MLVLFFDHYSPWYIECGIFQLSQTVILGLHQIVQAVQQYDYHTALQVYTQMVSQGNFSEISSFMPGLKMLIQSAMQMNVYVQTH